MNDAMQLASVTIAGMLLGAMYFGGLWWTVRKGLASPRPARWFIASLLLRFGITLTGFYLVAGADWKRLLACLLGFIIARAIVIRLTGTLSPTSLPQAGERDAVSLRDFHI